MPGVATPREIRLGLVLNGGVSLAVWIGGVTREIDAARRARAAPDEEDTTELYRRILEACDDTVVVDVIAGASAGGINGVLLGAALFADRPLPDLRETWLQIGDLGGLLEDPEDQDLRSILDGNSVLATAKEKLAELYEGRNAPPDRPLYLYVTATDLFGIPRHYADTAGRKFEEADFRRVIAFQHEPGDPASAPAGGALAPVVPLATKDAPELLAQAARSTSSFPVAFAANDVLTDLGDGEPAVTRFYVDGGILDNQPFNPVLDRISVLPAEGPVRRVVMYVVPYVSDSGTVSRELTDDQKATALATFGASGSLPRALPKLQSLDRITREVAAQKRAEDMRERLRRTLTPAGLEASACALFDSYVQTRLSSSLGLLDLWTSPDFRPGDGVSGQNAADDPPTVLPPTDDEMAAAGDPTTLPWIPPAADWSPDDATWRWGLSPGERTAAWALLSLRDALRAAPNAKATKDIMAARLVASRLVHELRSAKPAFHSAFVSASGETTLAKATAAYGSLAERLAGFQKRFRELQTKIEAANKDLPPEGRVPDVRTLLHVEVVRNALTIREESVPFPFSFVFASAGIVNSLGHGPATGVKPEDKLAGMKLGHFGGFLKYSWRQNDWLWGRVDGVEHVLRAILDVERIRETGAAATLAEVAFPGDSPHELPTLEACWDRAAAELELAGDRREAFVHALDQAATAPAGSQERRRYVEPCRAVLAARVQLRIIRAELPQLLKEARDDAGEERGFSPTAKGAVWADQWDPEEALTIERTVEAVSLFRSLDIGTESLEEESHRTVVHVLAARIVEVAVALFSSDGGGLPSGILRHAAAIRWFTRKAEGVYEWWERHLH